MARQPPDRTDSQPLAESALVGESEWLSVIRAHNLRGSYRDATAYADALPAAARARPAVALARARARMRQGHMIEAGTALAEAHHAAASIGEQLLLALEKASLLIYRDVAVRTALAAADSAFAALAGANLAQGDWAEAKRIHVRILLAAAVYYEISADAGHHARESLPELADILEQSGRIDESLAARLTYAERLERHEDRLNALLAVADRARDAGQPGLAGDAHISRANLLLANGAASDSIRAELDAADALFTGAAHVHGPIDARRVRIRLAIERNFALPDTLDTCLEAYRQIDYPRGALSLLLDQSQLAHERGNTASAAVYRRQALELAEATGMGLARDSALMGQIDLLMRASDHGSAIELCQAAIDARPPLFHEASYEQLLAAAYGFVRNLKAALEHGRRALNAFQSIGADDSASNAAIKLAVDLDSTRQEEHWEEAIRLLLEWAARDQHRGDHAAAMRKQELLAQIHMNRFHFSPEHHGDIGLLSIAEEALAVAEEIAHRLPKREAAPRLGSVSQIRGQLAQARGHSEGVEQSWRDALAIYESAGLSMEEANCRYIIGVIRLNRANVEPIPHFGESETNLLQALAYYVEAGMREQAADTRFMLAQLYANAALLVTPDLSEQLLNGALGHLTQGQGDYDAIRREFAAGPVLAAQVAKRTFSERSRRIHDLALQIQLRRQDPAEAWRWSQQAKARALGDALGASAAPPARILAELESHPESLALVANERELAARIENAPAGDRLALRAELAALRERMGHNPHLGEYLELRSGAAIESDDLEALLGSSALSGRPPVCVDWVQSGDKLALAVLRPGGTPQLVRLGLSVSDVRSFVLKNLSPDRFRSTLRDAPEILEELTPLVAPLANLTAAEELLVLSPTGPLHAVPLHALTVAGESLLIRNPVVYCPSLSVLRHCMARRQPVIGARTAALFGDPSGDRAEAAELVSYLGQRFGTRPNRQAEVIRKTFAEGVGRCDLVHFQGHAKHDLDEPLASRLEMADGPFTARDVFGLRDLRAELVTLAACESAASVIAAGDEPLGLIPAFLYAGAGAVLATLWPVHRASVTQAMRHFYDTLAAGSGNKAQALRAALLKIRSKPDFATPYHWAPFALYGDWR